LLGVLAGLVMLLPGICCWVWSASSDKDGLEIAARILGISVSFQALLSLLLYLLKISLNLGSLIGLYAFLLGLTLWGVFKRRSVRPDWTWLGAFVLFAIFLSWRLYQVKDLVLPAWVDSLHHVLIVRKMLEAGILPADLTPYLPGPFYYHYAFHASAANFAALSGLAPSQAVLIWGQVLNAGIGLSVYSLGKALFKDWKPALLAAFLVTFATKMPAYYLSWGRYTLLTGMLLLPLAAAAAVQWLQKDSHKNWAALILLTAGTLLAHYFTAVLLAIFLVLLWVWHLLQDWRQKDIDWKALITLSAAVVVGLLLALPWLLRVFQNTGMTMTPELVLPEQPNGYFENKDQWKYVWQLLGPNSGVAVLALALPGLLTAFWYPKLRAFASWSLLLMLLALPWGIRLGSFRFDHFAIILFLPLCLLAAGFVAQVGRWLIHLFKQHLLGHLMFAVVGFSLVSWGVLQTRDIVNQSTMLANQADVKALQWIDSNLPRDARFFVNTTGWGYDIYRGVDGGAWILPQTGRFSLAPTIFFPFGKDRSYIDQINDWGGRASLISGCNEEFWSLVQEADLTHIYIREGVGKLTASALESCVGIRRVYVYSGVSVWEIQP